MKYIDQLEDEFADLAEMDFPEEFDYLEELADQAGDYMKEAASSYHEAYANDTYDASISEYAYNNYEQKIFSPEYYLNSLLNLYGKIN